MRFSFRYGLSILFLWLSIFVFAQDGITIQKTVAASTLKDQIKAATSSINQGNKCAYLHENLTLPVTSSAGNVYNYTVSGTGLSADGKVTLTNNKQNATLKISLTNGTATADTTLSVSIAPDDSRSGYLFVHFTDNSVAGQELRFALSTKDQPLLFKTMLSGNPVVGGDSIAFTKCIRDPHILRGEDGYFYMVMTDMDCNLGWWSNYGMDIMKSKNLVNWKHSIVNFKTKYPAWQLTSGSTAVWAPQTIWDPKYINTDGSKGRYMIYYALRSSNVGNTIHFYYSYVNDDFSDLLGNPTELMPYSNGGSGDIDADILWSENDSVYHLFYTDGGIKQMTGSLLASGNWSVVNSGNNYNGSITSGVEGSTTYRLINSNSYMLLFDTGSNYYYSQSDDNLNSFPAFQVLDKSYITPRHGTVMTITQQEQDLLTQWNKLYNQLAGAKSIQTKGKGDNNLNAAIILGNSALSMGWNADVPTVSAAMSLANNALAAWISKYKLGHIIQNAQTITQLGTTGENLQQAIVNAKGVYDVSSDTTAINSAATQLQLSVNTYFRAIISTAENVTSSMKNVDFSSASITGWSGTTPGFGSGVAEFYNKVFDLNQTITGLSNGNYLINVQGFYRNGANDSGAGYSTGTEDINATLYGNSASVNMASLYGVAYSGSNSKNGFVDGMTGANTVFTLTSNNYANYLIAKVTNNSLTVGLKSTTTVTSDWTCFDNFTLYKLGVVSGVDTPVKDVAAKNCVIYNLLGIAVGKTDDFGNMPKQIKNGVYIINGVKQLYSKLN